MLLSILNTLILLSLVGGVVFITMLLRNGLTFTRTVSVTNNTGKTIPAGKHVSLPVADDNGQETMRLGADLPDQTTVGLICVWPVKLEGRMYWLALGAASALSLSVVLLIIVGLLFSSSRPSSQMPDSASTTDKETVQLAIDYLAALNKAQHHLDAAREAERRSQNLQNLAEKAKSVPEVAQPLIEDARGWTAKMATELAMYEHNKMITLEVMRKAKTKFAERDFETALGRYGRPIRQPEDGDKLGGSPSKERLPLETMIKPDDKKAKPGRDGGLK